MMYRTLNKPSSFRGGNIWSIFNCNWSALQSYPSMCRDIHIRWTLRTFTYIDMENRLDSFPDVHTGKTVFSFLGSGKTSDHLQVFLPAWISKIAAVTDSAESSGEHMQKETADKLFSIKQHGFLFSVVTVVFVGYRNTCCFYGNNPAVRYGCAVGISWKICDRVSITVKSFFHEDIPGSMVQPCEKIFKSIVVS